jgi:endonuclease YncB( thermonuclease family)
MRVLFVLSVFAQLSSEAHADTIAGRATVIDGDTLEIHGERIRVLYVDAPESQQRCTDRRGIDIQVWFCGSVAANKLRGLD